VTLGAVLITCLLAVQGYRWIEAPFQRLAKGLLQMRGS
jgi:peptidoglycan/LPS O-acetylase OafA/YrhL